MGKDSNLSIVSTKKSIPVKVLMIEAGSEMEMGIPPNIAVLVYAVRMACFEIIVFSVNDYKQNRLTGDEVRVNTLQVPPTAAHEIPIEPKITDMVSDFQTILKRYKPDIVGLSATEPTYESGLKLLQSIADNKIFTIVGGAHSTLNPEEVIAENCVDAVCIGEGEEALVELCQSMQAREIDYSIKNLWFKEGSAIMRNPLRPLTNLDDVPFQDWSPWKIPPRASKAMAGEIRTTALVELSRGCPFKCNFCANHFLNTTFKNNYRERSVDRFIEEIEYLRKKYALGFVYVADETILTTSKKRFRELIDKYASVKLPFWCQTRPEFITYEKVKLLKEVGMQAINIGIESGNPDFRKKILNRASSDDDIINGIRQARKADVRVGANVIIGFPGESRSQIFETIELVRDAMPTSTMVHLFQPYKRTVLREDSIKLGLITPDHNCGDYRVESLGTGIISPEELLGLQRTFNLYVDLPKNRWNEIKEAEFLDSKGNAKFAVLAKEYQLKHYGRTSF